MKIEIKDATRKFVIKGGIDWSNCLAVTLTMKQAHKGEALDEINASRNMRYFLRRLNKKVLGNAFERYRHKLNVIPVQEQSARIHYHLLIEVPTHQDGSRHDRAEFVREIEQQWKNTQFGHHEICIEDLSSDNPSGWVEYITKFENGETDQLDWENYHWITE